MHIDHRVGVEVEDATIQFLDVAVQLETRVRGGVGSDENVGVGGDIDVIVRLRPLDPCSVILVKGDVFHVL